MTLLFTFLFLNPQFPQLSSDDFHRNQWFGRHLQKKLHYYFHNHKVPSSVLFSLNFQILTHLNNNPGVYGYRGWELFLLASGGLGLNFNHLNLVSANDATAIGTFRENKTFDR